MKLFIKRLSSVTGSSVCFLNEPTVPDSNKHRNISSSYGGPEMTQTITLSQQRRVIWLIRARFEEKRPVRRQYITLLTTRTIKLLYHLLFLAFLHPSQVKYSALFSCWLCAAGGQIQLLKTERKASQTAAGEAITNLLTLISFLQRRKPERVFQTLNVERRNTAFCGAYGVIFPRSDPTAGLRHRKSAAVTVS